MLPAADLVGARPQEAGLSRKAGPAGARRPRAAGLHRPAPNRLWLTDITEHPTAEGKLYLCAVKDVCSNRIVGYSIDARMTAELAVDALRNAVALRGRPGGTVRATPTAAASSVPDAYVARCAEHGLRGSMGRVGACADNAAMESFFALLQKNVLNRRRWDTRDELRLAIVTWIEAPTTAAGANAPSAGSPRSSSRPSTKPLTRPEPPHRKRQPDLQQSRPFCRCGVYPRYVRQSHHVLHWADDGASDVDNAALVYQRHHTTLHRRRLAARVRRAPDELGRYVVWDLTDGSYDRHLERLGADRSAHDPPPLTPQRLRSLLVAATSSDVDDQRWAESDLARTGLDDDGVDESCLDEAWAVARLRELETAS